MTEFVVTKIPDLTWGEPRIARSVMKSGDPWGALAILKGTPWEDLFPQVPFQVFDQALRGYATPLMRIIGPPPVSLPKRLPITYTQCRDRKVCINAAPTCTPGKGMPECWGPEGLDGDAAEVASKVTRLWKEGVHVIVLLPEEGP